MSSPRCAPQTSGSHPPRRTRTSTTCRDSTLTPEQVAALEHRTEGWIAALQLAALSLRGRADVGGFIARFDGDDRYVVDYLVDEVLGHQPEPVRRFLAQAAILDRLTGPLCDAVTGGDDGGEMLTALDRANLFVVPLDDQREWYRFHHLFADVLRARLLAEQPDLVPLLHERASRWYERQDMADESVRHALAAGDMDRVVHLMEMEVASRPARPSGGHLHGLAEGRARRVRPAQSGAECLLRLHAHGLRESGCGRTTAPRR